MRKRSRSSTTQEYDGADAVSISTHVLDTERGEPARGVRVELYRGEELVAARETDEDGRIADLAGDEAVPDVYRLVFHPRSPFFRRVEVEVEVGPGHYHVPLLLAPYSCALYRGS
jgi:5-hydroxyisourate hydrolase